MSSRGILAAIAAAGVALSLAACDPASTTQGASANSSASPVTSPAETQATDGASTNTAAPQSATTAPGSGGATASDPGSTCQPTKLPANTKLVNLTRAASATTLYAKDTRPDCGGPDDTVTWLGSGPERTYPIAAGATFKLIIKDYPDSRATRDQFVTHTQKCESGQADPFASCNRGPGEATYKITMDGSGAITSISQFFYS